MSGPGGEREGELAEKGSSTEATAAVAVPRDSAATLFGILEEFFQVAVHLILFVRRLYPEKSFMTTTVFDVPVHQNRHPQVRAWVRHAVDQVLRQATGRGVKNVAVVVHAPWTERGQESEEEKVEKDEKEQPAGAVLERWVFDFHSLLAFPVDMEGLWQGGGGREGEPTKEDASSSSSPPTPSAAGKKQGDRRRAPADDENAAADRSSDRYDYYDEDEEYANAESEAELDADDADDSDGSSPGGANNNSINWTDLRDQLRAVLQRLAHAGSELQPLPPGCTFTMAVELPLQDKVDAAWTHSTNSIDSLTTATIRTVDVSPLFLECWVEECRHTGRDVSTDSPTKAQTRQ